MTLNLVRQQTQCLLTRGAAGFLLLLAGASPGAAYIDAGGLSITLPEVCLEFRKIAVLKVEKLDPDRGAVLFQVADVLQGAFAKGRVKHALGSGGQIPDFVRRLKPGDPVVFFTDCPDKRSITLTAWGWYLTEPGQDAWERGARLRPDLEAVFSGSVTELGDAIRRLRRGEPAVVAFRPHAPKETALYHVRYDFDTPHYRLPALPPKSVPADQPVAKWAENTRSQDPSVRYQAAVALGLSGESAFPYLSQLQKLLADTNAQVRLAAATALGTLHTDASRTVPALAAVLSDRDRFVCTAAARALRRFGADAKPALKRLLAAQEKSMGVYDFRPLRPGEIAETILVIAPESTAARPALRMLVKLLNDDRDDSNGSRIAGARALGRCGRATAAVLPALVTRLRDKELGVRVAAAEALLLMGGEAAPALAVLSSGLTAEAAWDRRETVRAIDRVGPLARPILPGLKKLRDDPDPHVRQAVEAALGRVEAR
jgi:HEAT repeat protein